MRRLLLALLTTLLLASFAMADTIYLRDGRTIRGTVLGFINGRFAVRLAPRPTTRPTTSSGYPNPNASPTLSDEGEIVFFRPAQIDRIEIDGRSLDDLRFDSRSLQVSLAPNWIDTGVDLRQNERVRVNASGTILVGRSRITPDGLRTTDPTAPLPNAAEGLLIGAVGNDPAAPIIELGQTREFVADQDGRLYLTVNRGNYTDARGAFTVQIRRERDLAAMRDDNQEQDEGTFSERRNEPAPVRSRTRLRYDTQPAGGPLEATFNVPGTSRGVDTNIEVRTGDSLNFTATGTVIAGRRIGQVGPEGGRTSGFGSIIGTRPVPTAGPGALIGVIRLTNGQTSQPFLIGSQLTITAPADGRLLLAINDDDYSDNGGSFTVKVRH